MTTFNRALVFTDIHFGLRSDSDLHNADCLEFIDWAIAQFHERKCDAVIFLGDWFHNRARVQWNTLWASDQALTKLGALGVPVYMLVGNHDMYLMDSRAIHAHPHVGRLPNFHLIDEITQIDDILFCPYLVRAEYTSVSNKTAPYMFGHFELPGFMTNATYEFEDQDGMQAEFFSGPKYVFSGHFHKRQWKTNRNGTHIIYIGNCFPHDFNDVGDRTRGCMIFEREQEPVFIDWPDTPNYNRLPLSSMLKLIENDSFPKPFTSRSTIHCSNDIKLAGTDLDELRDWLGTCGFRSIRIEAAPEDQDQAEAEPIAAPTENVTEFFLTGLNQVDTEGSKYDKERLRSIFKKHLGDEDHGTAI